MGNEQSQEHKTYKEGEYSGATFRDSLGTGKELRQGYGEMKFNDGAVYKGYWKDNKMDGPDGTMTFPNGNIYKGDFNENNPHGKGELILANGEKVKGTWHFQGRDDKIGSEVTGKYDVDVSIHDPNSNKDRQYAGPATVYLSSGLVKLPGMSDPKQSLTRQEKNQTTTIIEEDTVPVALGANNQTFIRRESERKVQQPSLGPLSNT